MSEELQVPVEFNSGKVPTESSEKDLALGAKDEQLIVEVLDEVHLRKNFRWYELVCTCFCANNVPAVIGLLLNINYNNGGIPSLVYGMAMCYFGACMAALPIAEMCSVIPTVGGVYHHAIYLAPPKWKAFWGWWTGLINMIGWLLNSASTALLAAQGIVGFVQIFKDGYVVTTWELWFIGVALYAPFLIINIWGIKYFGRIDMVTVIVQVVGVTAILIAVLAINKPLASAADVFVNVTYSNPANSLGSTLMIGFFTSTTTASGIDGAAHLAEEVQNPRRIVPRILMAVVACGGFCGVFYAILYGFASTNVELLLTTSSYYPVVMLVREALTSNAAAVIFNLVITMVAAVGAMGSLLVTSRQLMSLAQDGMFPTWMRLHEIHPGFRLPIISLIACTIACCLFNLLYLTGSTGWNALNCVCVGSFNACYATVVGLAMWHGRKNLPVDRKFKVPILLGYFTDFIGLSYELFSLVILSYPGSMPFTFDVFNWGSVAEIALMLLVLLGWFTYGRRNYKAVDVERLAAVADLHDELEPETH